MSEILPAGSLFPHIQLALLSSYRKLSFSVVGKQGEGEVVFFCLRGATALLVAALQPVATRWTRSFQLTHMSREDHAHSLIAMSSQQWRPTVRQELITVLTTSPAR